MPTYSRTTEQTLWVAQESTFDTTPGSTSSDSFAAGDHVLVRDVSLNGAQEFQPITDEKDNTSTIKDTVPKRKTGTFSVSGYYRHAGTSSGTPHQHLFFLNGFGSFSAGGSEAQYNLTTSNVSSLSLMVGDKDNDNQVKIGNGAIVQSLTLQAAGDGLVEYTAEGECAEVIYTGRTTVPNGASASLTTLSLGDASVCMTGSIFVVGSQGGERIKVTAVTNSNNNVTVTRGWGANASAAITSGATLLPWHPSAATAPTTSPICGAIGTHSLSGEAIKIQNVEINCTFPRRLINDQYGTNKAQAVIASGKREINVTTTGRIERAMLDQIMDAGIHNTQKALIVDFGATAGTNLIRFTASTAEAETMPEMDNSGEEEVTITTTYRCISSTAESDCQLKQL